MILSHEGIFVTRQGVTFVQAMIRCSAKQFGAAAVQIKGVLLQEHVFNQIKSKLVTGELI